MMAVVLSAALVVAVGAAAPGSLDEAIDLYHAARFAEALEMLDALDAAGDGNGAGEAVKGRITEYRALCLLALDREAEARAAVEKLMVAHFAYRADADTPPRLAALIERVRAELLPEVVRTEYRRGKASFDRKAYPEARDHFRTVVTILEGAGVDEATRESLADLQDVATGYLDIIDANAGPAGDPPPAVATLAPSAAPPAAPSPRLSREEAGVVPPVVIRQDLPAWHGVEGANRRLDIGPLKGMLEVSIDETGRVEDARLTTPIHPFYDSRLIQAARQWQYQPATRDGVAVKYVKRIAIELVNRQAPVS